MNSECVYSLITTMCTHTPQLVNGITCDLTLPTNPIHILYVPTLVCM